MWHRPAICNGGRRLHCFLTSPIGGVAVGGSLRSSLSGSRPTSHSQGHDFLKQLNLMDVSSRNLVQFGFSGVPYLDIFLVIGSIELVSAHIDIC